MAPSCTRARRLPVPFLALWVSTLALPQAGPARAQEANATTASTSMYVRTDTDRTTVYTPRLHVGAPLSEASRLDLVYTVDVWSSASIDIRTSATPRVVEQRDEIDVSAEHGLGDTTLGASYRYSIEYDYESHGGSLGVSRDLATKSATVALTARAYFDRVGRAGDPGFERDASLLTARGAFTQVIDPDTVGQVIYEATLQRGYQSSPYRYVRFASSEDELPRTCALPVRMCLPEENPDSRLRHAAAVSGRRALGRSLSVGAGYRFYIDDWGMTSHTATADGALSVGEGWLFSLGYRYYTQSKADHYQPFYLASAPIAGHYTSDKELSTLQNHRAELELGRDWSLDGAGTVFNAVLLVAPSYYRYDDFPLLDSVSALELTAALELRLL